MIDVGTGHRNAREHLAEILGRTHGSAVHARCDPAAGNAAAQHPQHWLFLPQFRLTLLFALWLWRSAGRRPALRRVASSVARHATIADLGQSRNGGSLRARVQFLRQRGLELMEPLSFKGRKGSGLPGGRTLMLTFRCGPRAMTLKNISKPIGSGAAAFTPRMAMRTANAAACNNNSDEVRKQWKARWHPPAKFCRWSRRHIARPRLTIFTGRRCIITCQSWTRNGSILTATHPARNVLAWSARSIQNFSWASMNMPMNC